MGGGTRPAEAAHCFRHGLSPRGRGNPLGESVGALVPGSIPAWAGEPGNPGQARQLAGVYPRVGGGTFGRQQKSYHNGGLSPRGRGNLSDACQPAAGRRSIPAWAGEPPPLPRPTRRTPVYPRVGGGTACVGALPASKGGLSPRGRGNHSPLLTCPVKTGSIPAWAGEPGPASAPGSAPGVYPRVGGGTIPPMTIAQAGTGLSPRGRGNPGWWVWGMSLWRSIPAWAGEPAACPCAILPPEVYPRVGGGTGSY